MGGVTFPMLSDFHPHGQVSSLYGAYNPDRGTSTRTLFIIDTAGKVSFRKEGQPDMAELLAELDKIN